MPQDKEDHQGIITKDSPYASVSETLERLEEAVREKGLQTFATFNLRESARPRLDRTLRQNVARGYTAPAR